MAAPRRSGGGYVRSVLSEIAHTLTHRPSFAASDRRSIRLLLGVFVLVFAILAVVVYIYVSQLVPAPPPRIVFTAPRMVGGNATFNVSQVLYGPYPASKFTAVLDVNNVAAQTALGVGGENVSVTIGAGMNAVTVLLEWQDVDHDGAVSVGDAFWVRGSGTSLPLLSTCTLTLVWVDGSWSASARWVTSSE